MAEQHLMALAKPLLPQGFLQTSWTCQWQQQRSWLVTPEATLHPLSPRAAAVRSEKKGIQLSYETLAAIACPSRTNSEVTNLKAITKGQWSLGTFSLGASGASGLNLWKGTSWRREQDGVNNKWCRCQKEFEM